MQRVSALIPSWDRSSRRSSAASSKTSIDKVRGWADKLPSSVNRLSAGRHGRDALLPAALDRECEKAARILKSFCYDGFAMLDDRPGSPSTFSNGQSSQLLKRIPPRIIQNAVGLAIFSSMRPGLWSSNSGGSGILIARKSDGLWSPPSGLMLQTAGLGFVLGSDIYDCVFVINTFTVLETFRRTKLVLGTDVSMTAGPVMALGMVEGGSTWADLSDTVISYIKTKGQAADISLDGMALLERSDENEKFYGTNTDVSKILNGDINLSLPQLRPLTEVLKAAEGRTDYDTILVEQLSAQPTPGDATLEPSKTVSDPCQDFGVPGEDDPDPFGVLALEMAGLEIREAGSRLRPESKQFEYNPSPTSPMFSRLSRRSGDTFHSRSQRASYMSTRTMATERSLTVEGSTNTYANTPGTTPSTSQSQSEDGHPSSINEDIPELKEPEEVDYTKIDLSALRSLSAFPDLDEELPVTTMSPKENVTSMEDTKLEEPARVGTSPTLSITRPTSQGSTGNLDDIEDNVAEDEDLDDGSDEDDFEDAEEAIVYEVATAQAPQRMTIGAGHIVPAKGAVVTIPRRVPPPLPIRNPERMSKRKSQMGDVGMLSSPLRQEFDVGEDHDILNTPTGRGSTSPLTSGAYSIPTTPELESDHEETVNTKSSWDSLKARRHSAVSDESRPASPVSIRSSAPASTQRIKVDSKLDGATKDTTTSVEAQ
ncbi:SH3 domain-containing YSC84-like protein 1 [Microdochium nivale]|nr:SH3 domain-containing YSC84-like protein 1 [Microdochium nivale]